MRSRTIKVIVNWRFFNKLYYDLKKNGYVFIVIDLHILEPQKNGSFVSTNNTEDGLVLMQSSISMGGHTLGGQTEADDETEYKTGILFY